MDVIHTRLADGLPVCIRRVRPADEERLKAGIALLTPKSRYLRFFSGLREAPQFVVDRLVNVDDHDHIAWGALRTDVEGAPALGVVHAFRNVDDPTQAEFSVAVIDAYHGRGLARLLTAVLLIDCRNQGFERLLVHILAENFAARSFVRGLGGKRIERNGPVEMSEIDIPKAITRLRENQELDALVPIFAHFDP